MGYGQITTTQKNLIKKTVVGKVVLDLGCGDCEHARTLVQLGATKVIAIDSSDNYTRREHPLVEFDRIRFSDFLAEQKTTTRFDVGFLSWPSNHYLPGLLPLLDRCDTIIFLGCNTDGSACGWVGLYEYLLKRRLDGYEPDRKNSLVIYGPAAKEPRIPFDAEWAGLDEESLFTFEQAERQPSGSSDRFPA